MLILLCNAFHLSVDIFIIVVFIIVVVRRNVPCYHHGLLCYRCITPVKYVTVRSGLT